MTAQPSPLTRLAATGTTYAVGVAVQVLVQAASLPILTRLLDPTEYGLSATCLVIANLLAVAMDLGLARSVTRAYFREPDGRRQAGSLVVGALVVVALLSTVALLTSSLWGGWLGSGARSAVQAAVLLGAAMAGRNVVLGMLRAADLSRAYLAVMLLGTAGAQLLGLAAAMWVATPAAYLSGLAVGSAAGVAVGLVVLRPRVADLGEVWRWGLRFGAPLVPGELAAVAIWFADRIVIERFLGLGAVGRYQIAYTLGSLILMVVMAVSQAWAPIVYGAAGPERGRVADETHAALARLTSLGVAALSMAAPVMLVLLIPGEYRPSGLFLVTAVVALSALPLVTQQAAMHLLADAERTAVLGSRGVVAAVLNVALNLVLVPLWGLAGSALATLLTYVVYAAITAQAAQRLVGARLHVPWRPWLWAVVGAGAGAALPASGGWGALRVVLAAAVLVLCVRELRSAWVVPGQVPT